MKKTVALQLVLDAANSWVDHMNREIIPRLPSEPEVDSYEEHCDRINKAILELDR